MSWLILRYNRPYPRFSILIVSFYAEITLSHDIDVHDNCFIRRVFRSSESDNPHCTREQLFSFP